MQDNNTVESSGSGLFGIGATVWIVFLILKCCGVLPETFTWFWVWFPLWIVPAIMVALGLIIVIIIVISDLLD